MDPLPINLMMNRGGIGDMLYYTQAIKFLGQHSPHLYGKVIPHPMFMELAKHWITEFEVTREVDKEWPIHSPRINSPDQMGFHMNQIAFMYYLNMRVPKGWEGLPLIKGDERDISEFKLPFDYAVMLPGGTELNRTMSADTAKKVADHLRKKGLEPVILGRNHIHTDKNTGAYTTNFSVKPADLGIDLVDKTTLLDAACVMANAKIVVGIDGGMLHLACCSEVPVVFGLTVASWRNRKPYREAKTIPIVDETLPCIYCQERIRMLYTHDFKKCLNRGETENICARN